MSEKYGIKELLASKDKGAGRTAGVTGVLTRLWRNMLGDLNISGLRWSTYMEAYVRKECERLNRDNNRVDRTSIRGNLVKEFIRPRMTWKVFFKGMVFLKIRRFKIIIVAEHEDGRITEHSTIVDNSELADRPMPAFAVSASKAEDQAPEEKEVTPHEQKH